MSFITPKLLTRRKHRKANDERRKKKRKKMTQHVVGYHMHKGMPSTELSKLH